MPPKLLDTSTAHNTNHSFVGTIWDSQFSRKLAHISSTPSEAPMTTKRTFILSLIAAAAFVAHGSTSVASGQETPAALNFTMKSINGDDVSLSKYAGKVVVLVNVASKCGHTPQYKQLQELHATYAAKGVAVIGVPCNQFKSQEPGTDKEILKFCQKNYGVEFDLFSKVDVNGADQCDLYKHLNALDVAPKGKGDVKWNFEKYIIDRTGKPVGRFATKVRVDSDEFMAVLKKAMGDTGHYSHTSEKHGRTYYLFSKSVPRMNSDKIQTIYFFAKDADNKKGTPLAAVPEGKMVSETKKGMLVLKNKPKK